MAIQTWEKLNESAYKAGHRKMLNRTFELPSGEIADFDLINSGNVVCILALTSDNSVILAKQYRPAQERILLEIPGGGIEHNERPENAAHRELLEETGYSGKIQFVCTTLQSAYDTLVRYNFVATECILKAEPANDPKEPIETVLMPLPEFKTHLYSGELTDPTTGMLGLHFLKLL